MTLNIILVVTQVWVDQPVYSQSLKLASTGLDNLIKKMPRAACPLSINKQECQLKDVYPDK